MRLTSMFVTCGSSSFAGRVCRCKKHCLPASGMRFDRMQATHTHGGEVPREVCGQLGVKAHAHGLLLSCWAGHGATGGGAHRASAAERRCHGHEAIGSHRQQADERKRGLHGCPGRVGRW